MSNSFEMAMGYPLEAEKAKTQETEEVKQEKPKKATAKKALLRHYKGKRLMPKIFASENHIDEIKGVYVPFWLFDATADASAKFKATRVRSWSTPNHIYTETSHYSLLRAGSISFSRVPVDGSTKMADDLMESLEPYDHSQAVAFNTAYLSFYPTILKIDII